MIKFFRFSIALFFMTNLYVNTSWAQEVPVEPPAEPKPPVLVKFDLTPADSQALFNILNKWQLVVTNNQTQTKWIETSAIVCVENLEGDRELGCSLYDDYRFRDVTKYDQNADPLFKFLIQHIPLECEDESDTCIIAAEKITCSLYATRYACSLEAFISEGLR